MVNKKLKVPLYLQIYNDLKKKILENRFEDEFLPSERILSEEYNVERATLRRSLQLLVDDSLLIKVPGSGSKVNQDYIPKQNGAADTSSNIAFILPGDGGDKINEPQVAALFYNFERECHNHNYSLFYSKFDTEEELYDKVAKTPVKGIVWVSRVNERLVQQARKLNIPSVCVSNFVPGFITVLSDNYEGSFLAVNHLVQLGHRRIAYINGIKSYLNSVERYGGYIRALDHFGIPFDESLVRSGDWSFESGYDAMNDLIDAASGPTAVFAANDMMALGAIKAIIDRGLSVPDDISVVGFDNIDQGMYFSPSLTTVEINSVTFAREILKALNQTIEDIDSPPVKVLIPNNLVIRESTRKLV